MVYSFKKHLQAIMCFGICGATRMDELVNLLVTDVIDYKDMFKVYLRETKNHTSRYFTIADEFYNYVARYRALRPKNCPLDRFFLNYQNGKCTNQPIGRHKFQKIPKDIAAYLQLPNFETYTGHSFRRTSATIAANTGMDITTLKRHTGHKSTASCEGYIQESVTQKVRVGAAISSMVFGNKENTQPASTSNFKVPQNISSKCHVNPQPSTSTAHPTIDELGRENDTNYQQENSAADPISHSSKMDQTTETTTEAAANRIINVPKNEPFSINLTNCSQIYFYLKE